MVLYPAATSADSPLAHMVAHPLQLALVVLFHPPTGANTALALGQLALCGGVCVVVVCVVVVVYVEVEVLYMKTTRTL